MCIRDRYQRRVHGQFARLGISKNFLINADVILVVYIVLWIVQLLIIRLQSGLNLEILSMGGFMKYDRFLFFAKIFLIQVLINFHETNYLLLSVYVFLQIPYFNYNTFFSVGSFLIAQALLLYEIYFFYYFQKKLADPKKNQIWISYSFSSFTRDIQIDRQSDIALFIFNNQLQNQRPQRAKDKFIKLYHLLSYLKKTALAAVLVFVDNKSDYNMQCLLILIINTIWIVFLLVLQPFISRSRNIIKALAEFLILLIFGSIFYSNMIFQEIKSNSSSGSVQTNSRFFLLGWIQIILIIVSNLLNIAIFIIDKFNKPMINFFRKHKRIQ
eukprot:TRINITY_DN6878_c0_g1_i4.p1 TRINITY_DN6878_c0_g1~~TRINITY_DN6878_c0_g1_i4.p1  ORF type:complete len:327 (-),score=34.00 TRINITY_DN6878_c0_g1_i4:332-1312(-)